MAALDQGLTRIPSGSSTSGSPPGVITCLGVGAEALRLRPAHLVLLELLLELLRNFDPSLWKPALSFRCPLGVPFSVRASLFTMGGYTMGIL